MRYPIHPTLLIQITLVFTQEYFRLFSFITHIYYLSSILIRKFNIWVMLSKKPTVRVETLFAKTIQLDHMTNPDKTGAEQLQIIKSVRYICNLNTARSAIHEIKHNVR